MLAGMYRFGVFQFDAARLELSRDGRPVRLQPQPAHVLATLIAGAGRTVTREELRQAVWGGDTFVDFDRGLNFCIAQIRSALGDDAGSPRYVRTVPKRGYEFVCPIHEDGRPDVHEDHDVHQTQPPDGLGHARGLRAWVVVAAIGVLAFVSFLAYHALWSPRVAPIVAVVRFDNETGDASLSRFADNLTDTVTAQLTTVSGGTFGVIGNAAILRRPRSERDLRTIATSLRAGFIVLGQVQRDHERVRILAHLIRMPEQTHVRVSRTDEVPQQTLREADEIAGRIARAFGAALLDPASRASRVAATR